MRVPVVGQVSVPSAERLAFYGGLGILAVVNVISWPVALAIGVGAAVAARDVNHRPVSRPKKRDSAGKKEGSCRQANSNP